jgi:hypothetical protein
MWIARVKEPVNKGKKNEKDRKKGKRIARRADIQQTYSRGSCASKLHRHTEDVLQRQLRLMLHKHTVDVQQRQLRLNAAQPLTHSTHTHALARRLSHLGRAHGGLQLLRALRLSIRALRRDLLRLRQYLYFCTSTASKLSTEAFRTPKPSRCATLARSADSSCTCPCL